MKVGYKYQCFKQVLIYLGEVIGFPLLGVIISEQFVPVANFMAGLQRWLAFYAIYQVLVIVIATNINDIHKDSWFAAKLIYDLLKHSKTCNDKNAKDLAKKQIECALDKDTIITPAARKVIEKVNEETTLNDIDRELILINHQIAYCDLKWRFSLFLRFFK